MRRSGPLDAVFIACLVAGICLGLASPTAALDTGTPESGSMPAAPMARAWPVQPPSAAEVARARWVGRFCTGPGCASPPARPWTTAAAFGAAVVASGWLSRRRGDTFA